MPASDSAMPLTQETLERLCADISAVLRARLGGPVKAVFDAADDTLFELAEHTSDGARQQQYFDGMRECRRKRSAVERGFLQAMADRLLWQEQREDASGGFRRLSLLGEEELEESLAISAMVGKAEGQYARALVALNQRLGFMFGNPILDDSSNPVGPAQLTETFRAASEELSLGTEARLVVFKLFERHVLGALEPIYSEINILLANAGVLPTLSAWTPGKQAPSRPRQPVAPPPDRPRHEVRRDEATIEAEARLLSEVLTLLRTGPHSGGRTGESGVAGPTLLGALSRLQRAAAVDPPSSPDPAALKQALLAEFGQMAEAGPGPSALEPRHEDIIDLIGMMFDFVSHDRNIPDRMQGQLARLHLPFLKAALKDPALLANPRHPAWELLEELDFAALSWSPGADPGDRLYGRIRDTVDTLLNKFDGDPGLFERLRDELRAFTQATRRRAELAEQRAVEAALGRERLKLARTQVRAALAKRLERQDAAPWLRTVINRPWANYLVLQWLRQGENSNAYQEALAFVDDLLWAARSGASESERSRLAALLPQLEMKLRHGLATVAYHDSEIDTLTGQLADYVRARMGEQPEPGFVASGGDAAPAMPFDDDAELDVEEQPAPESVDSELVERIRAAEPGTWFEFSPKERGAERAKLSWISPISGRCLFVNRTGLKVADVTPEQLAQEVQAGMARILEGTNLLQRALQEISGLLRGRSDDGSQRSG